ncbi:unnamed protein product [Thlaspi arvense]|uniref:Uncharacterized protein n=1 Tax=Thlaspi arvense TaxID=13288 RepID=A0AAU9RG81_THLAR|nr:unnamed protein product [Thlaspi arvense]
MKDHLQSACFLGGVCGELMDQRLKEAAKAGDLNALQGKERITPLHYVAETDNIDLLAEFLYACPASIEDLNIRNETALHIAVKNFRLRAFKVLLGWLLKTLRREVLNWRDEDGNTALHIAVATDQTQVCWFSLGY